MNTPTAETVDFPVPIGVLSCYTRCSIDCIRYYETIGLLGAIPRTGGGHRVYGKTHYQRLIFIRQCRSLDFSIDEIHHLLTRIDAGDCRCSEVRRRLERHLADIRCGIRHLEAVADVLVTLIDDCAQMRSVCPAIAFLSRDDSVPLPSFRLSVAANLRRPA